MNHCHVLNPFLAKKYLKHRKLLLLNNNRIIEKEKLLVGNYFFCTLFFLELSTEEKCNVGQHSAMTTFQKADRVFYFKTMTFANKFFCGEVFFQMLRDLRD